MRALSIACVVGAALSVGLLGAEVGRKPALVVGRQTEVRAGQVSTISFEVRNDTGRPLCPEVRVAARDREARDLAHAVAAPAAPGGAILPHRALAYTAVLRIDAVDYQEKVQKIRAFVYDERACPAPG